jgi:uncharacterized protein
MNTKQVAALFLSFVICMASTDAFSRDVCQKPQGPQLAAKQQLTAICKSAVLTTAYREMQDAYLAALKVATNKAFVRKFLTDWYANDLARCRDSVRCSEEAIAQSRRTLEGFRDLFVEQNKSPPKRGYALAFGGWKDREIEALFQRILDTNASDTPFACELRVPADVTRIRKPSWADLSPEQSAQLYFQIYGRELSYWLSRTSARSTDPAPLFQVAEMDLFGSGKVQPIVRSALGSCSTAKDWPTFTVTYYFYDPTSTMIDLPNSKWLPADKDIVLISGRAHFVAFGNFKRAAGEDEFLSRPARLAKEVRIFAVADIFNIGLRDRDGRLDLPGAFKHEEFAEYWYLPGKKVTVSKPQGVKK